jgi:hypothetical protein
MGQRSRFEMSEQLLQKILEKLTVMESTMATQNDIEKLNAKLDSVHSQVAHNTEHEVIVTELSARVDELGTDVKLIKKLLTNQ